MFTKTKKELSKIGCKLKKLYSKSIIKSNIGDCLVAITIGGILTVVGVSSAFIVGLNNKGEILPTVTDNSLTPKVVSSISTTEAITTTSQVVVTTQTTTTTTSDETTSTTTVTDVTTTETTETIETYIEEVVISEEEPIVEYVDEPEVIEEETYVEESSTVAEETQEEVVDETLTYLGNMRITGYVATGNPTASGEYPYVGGVAMSTSYGLPYGTQIYIDGLGYYVINDTGCASGVVDVFVNSVSEAYALTSYADVYIVN